jgi:hypothetical protein
MIMESKILKRTPRMNYSQIKSYSETCLGKTHAYCVRHPDGDWLLTFVFEHEEKKMDVAMSSQRQDIRTFKTIDAARNACDFVGGMTVLGK